MKISRLFVIVIFFILSLFKYFLNIFIIFIIKVLSKNKMDKDIISIFFLKYYISYKNTCHFIYLDK